MAMIRKYSPGSNQNKGDDSLSESLELLLQEHKELRRRTAFINQSLQDFPRRTYQVEPVAAGEPFEAWALRKDRDLQDRRARQAQIEEEKEREKFEEDERCRLQEEEAKRKREISLNKFMQRVEEYEDERRQKALSIKKSEDIKQRHREIRRTKGEAAYKKWQSKQEHIAYSTDHSSSATPCRPSSQNKSLSFDDWLESIEARPSPPPFCNPHPWVEPEPAPLADLTVAAPAVERRPPTLQPSRAPKEGGIIGIRAMQQLPKRAVSVSTRKERSAPPPPRVPDMVSYQDPSPPLLWRDRDLTERLAQKAALR